MASLGWTDRIVSGQISRNNEYITVAEMKHAVFTVYNFAMLLYKCNSTLKLLCASFPPKRLLTDISVGRSLSFTPELIDKLISLLQIINSEVRICSKQ